MIYRESVCMYVYIYTLYIYQRVTKGKYEKIAYLVYKGVAK